jgi:hypothetical protein
MAGLVFIINTITSPIFMSQSPNLSDLRNAAQMESDQPAGDKQEEQGEALPPSAEARAADGEHPLGSDR